MGSLVAGRWFGWLRSGNGIRYVGLDVARCLALVGMMTTHILPHMVAGEVGWQQQLTTGNSAALFAVLAGASLALLSGQATPFTNRRRWLAAIALAVRAALICCWGIALQRLQVPGVAVILPFYGLLFLFGIPFMGLRSRALFWWAGSWAVAAPIASMLIRRDIPINSDGGFSGLSLALVIERLLLTGSYPAFTWVAYLLAGMAVGRLALDRRESAIRLAVGGSAVALGATIVSSLATSLPIVRSTLLATSPQPVSTWSQLTALMQEGMDGVTPRDNWWWLMVDAPHSGSSFDLARSGGIALSVIGIALLATRVWTRTWQVAFGAGAMTLTLYSLHLLMLLPGTWPDLGAPRWWAEVPLVLAIGVAFAAMRLRGPLEVAVRLACYGASRLGDQLLPANVGAVSDHARRPAS